MSKIPNCLILIPTQQLHIRSPHIRLPTFRIFADDAFLFQFLQMSRTAQDECLQFLYDEGYDVQVIADKLRLNRSSIYNRINANRGRGPGNN